MSSKIKKSGHWKRLYDEAALSSNRFQAMLITILEHKSPEGFEFCGDELFKNLIGRKVITYDLNKKDNKIRRGKRRVRKMKKIIPEGRWLDIECSAGFILSVAKMANYDTYGIEIDPLGVKYAREVLGLDNIFQGTFEEQHLDDNFFNIITLLRVI